MGRTRTRWSPCALDELPRQAHLFRLVNGVTFDGDGFLANTLRTLVRQLKAPRECTPSLPSARSLRIKRPHGPTSPGRKAPQHGVGERLFKVKCRCKRHLKCWWNLAKSATIKVYRPSEPAADSTVFSEVGGTSAIRVCKHRYQCSGSALQKADTIRTSLKPTSEFTAQGHQSCVLPTGSLCPTISGHFDGKSK